jgi:hypothetical protein
MLLSAQPLPRCLMQPPACSQPAKTDVVEETGKRW